MPDLQAMKMQLDSLKEKDISLKQKIAEACLRISSLSARIQQEENSIQDLNQVTVILTAAATAARDNAKGHFERIITDALQFVTQNPDYKFVIQEKNSKTKAAYEFFIESTVNGVKCLQKPEDANGGGFVDIISVAAKYAYLEIFSDPKIQSATMLCDEPGKMISADMSVKFAEYLKFLGNHYGRQIIMVTHNDSIASVATKTFTVTKDRSGVSKAVEVTPNATFDLAALFNGALEGLNQ